MITPTEAYEKAKSNPQDMKKLEKIIDDTIISGIRSGQNAIYLDTKVFPNVVVRKEIMNKYRTAGWDVKYESDQREGDYLIFKNNNQQFNDWPYNHERSVQYFDER